MGNQHEVPLARITGAVRRLVEEKLEDELPFFEGLASFFEAQGLGRRWNLRMLDAVSVEPGLGVGDRKVTDFVTPRVFGATHAAVLDAFESLGTPDRQTVKELVEYRAREYKVPGILVPRLEELVYCLVRADFGSISLMPFGDPMEGHVTLIRWDSATATGSPEEIGSRLEQTRAEKAHLDLYFDDIRNEFLVKGIDKALSILQRQLLVRLLMRVGSYWPYAELFHRIWGDEATRANTFHQLLRVLHETTEGILKNYVDMPPGVERCYIKEDLRQKVTYAVIFAAGEYY